MIYLVDRCSAEVYKGVGYKVDIKMKASYCEMTKEKYNEYRDYLDKHLTRYPSVENPGAQFFDLYEIYESPELRERAIDAAVYAINAKLKGKFNAIAALDGRAGALLAIPVAEALGTTFIRVCENRSRPGEMVSASIERVTGKKEIFIAKAEVPPGTRVLLFTDIMNTGATVTTASNLLTQLGAQVTGHFAVGASRSLVAKMTPAQLDNFVHLLQLPGITEDEFKAAHASLDKELTLTHDYPQPGKNFLHSFALMHKPEVREHLINCLAHVALTKFSGKVTAVIGVENRGMYFAEVVARVLNLPLVLVTRTEDRLYVPSSELYASETKGEAEKRRFICKKDKLKPGNKLLAVADVLISGKSLLAVEDIAQQAGSEVVGYITLCKNSTGHPEAPLKHPDQLASLFTRPLTT